MQLPTWCPCKCFISLPCLCIQPFLLQCRYLLSPACPDTYQIKQLLRWFREACREESDDFPKGDTRCVALCRLRMHKQSHIVCVAGSFTDTPTLFAGLELCCDMHAVPLLQHVLCMVCMVCCVLQGCAEPPCLPVQA